MKNENEKQITKKEEKKKVKDLSGGQIFTEKDYVDIKIIMSYKSTGQIDEHGDDVVVPVPKVKIKKTNIEKLVNADKDTCGVKNAIRLFNATGDASVFNKKQCLPDGDYSKGIPIPDEIKKELDPKIAEKLTTEQILKGLTKEQLDALVKSIVNVSEAKEVESKADDIEKKEVKENE